MAGVVCSLSPEASDAIERILGDTTLDQALILRCNKRDAVIVVDRLVEGVGPEDLGDELPDSSPRFVLYRRGIKLDDAHVQPMFLFIFFNPMDVDVLIKGMYIVSKSTVHAAAPGLKEVEIRQPENFTEEWLSNRAIGITGRAK